MTREERARGLFADSYNCAQAVAMAFSPDTGIDEGASCRMMTAFGAGSGRRQLCCGAVSGALFVISILRGRGPGEDKAAQDAAYSLAREFFASFEALHGSSECRVLLDGTDLLTPEGQARFKAEGMKLRCADFVGRAIRILEELIEADR